MHVLTLRSGIYQKQFIVVAVSEDTAALEAHKESEDAKLRACVDEFRKEQSCFTSDWERIVKTKDFAYSAQVLRSDPHNYYEYSIQEVLSLPPKCPHAGNKLAQERVVLVCTECGEEVN